MTTDPSQYFNGRTVQEQMKEVIGYVDTRAAEVATDAIASDVAQVHQDMLDADADASAAAASAAAAAGTLANAVKKTGESSQSIAGDISVSGDVGVGGDLSVTGTATVQAPVNNTDAATKKYVDDYHDATKLDISDVNSYAVGLTGNQGPITGIKTFNSPIVGSAMNFISSQSSNAASTGLYRCIMKVPKSAMTGARNHYIFWFFTRARGRAPDILTIYTSNTVLQGFAMVLRANTENYTYVLSSDNDYVYMYILTSANASDAYQLLCQFSSEGNAPLVNDDTGLGDFAAVTGTEYARLTP